MAPAAQILSDFGTDVPITFDKLSQRLPQRFGLQGQAETFRTKLYHRKQEEHESLNDLLHDILRLTNLAFPAQQGPVTESIARDAFLEAIADKELSLKVRERIPV